MKTKLLLMTIAAVAITFAGCNNDNDDDTEPSVIEPTFLYVREPSNIVTSADGGTYTIWLDCNTAWSATTNAAWCTISPVAGNSYGEIMITVARNPTVESRISSITISADTITRHISVTQYDNLPTPPYASTTQTWALGQLLWSDVIRISDCNNYNGGASLPTADIAHCVFYYDTRDYSSWIFYNGFYVQNYADDLCPNPWRVPTLNDLAMLCDIYPEAPTDKNLRDHWRDYPPTFGISFWSSTKSWTNFAYGYNHGQWPCPDEWSLRSYALVKCVR